MAEQDSSENRIVTISINDLCPLNCKHCSVGYTEGFRGTAEKMDGPSLRKAILAVDPDIYDIVSFVGGEPTLAPDLLRIGIEACQEIGVVPAITTAPVWAKTREQADRFLQKLPLDFAINLSFDDYHLEFLTPEHYINAVEATRSYGAWVVMTLCYTRESEKVSLLGKISSVIHLISNINSQLVVPLGNASHDKSKLDQPLVKIETAEDLDRLERTCHVGDAFITRNSELHGCCYSSAYDDSPLLYNSEVDIAASFTQMENDATFQAFLEKGFLDSLSDRARAAIVDEFRGEGMANECDVCLKMMSRKYRHLWERFVHYESGVPH